MSDSSDKLNETFHCVIKLYMDHVQDIIRQVATLIAKQYISETPVVTSEGQINCIIIYLQPPQHSPDDKWQPRLPRFL